MRAKILSEDPIAGSTFPLIRRLSYTQMFRFGNPPNYLPKKAELRGRDGRARGSSRPPELAYDILIEDDGRNFLYTPIVNYSDYSLSAPRDDAVDRNAIMGLGDGGAHVGFILDAGFPTWLLTYWGRERSASRSRSSCAG